MKKIKLVWSADGVIDSYIVYRSLETISIDNLPEPLETNILNKEFIDTSVAEGSKYYYRIASKRKTIEKISEEIVIEVPKEVDLEVPMIVKTSSNVNEVSLNITGALFTVDWGDGVIENSVDLSYYTYSYATENEYEIIITPEEGSISQEGITLDYFYGISEVMQWFKEGYSFLSFTAGYGNDQDTLIKVPTTVPKMKEGNFESMFALCTVFNDPSIVSWDMSSAIKTNMMFNRATLFNQPIGVWNVLNVINMHSMFKSATSFNQPLESWVVANVIVFISMFRNASSFNQSINSWNVSNASEITPAYPYSGMYDMFNYAVSYNKDMSNWCVTKITSEPVSFKLNTTINPEYLPVWGTCPNG